MTEPKGRTSRGYGKVYTHNGVEYVSVTTAIGALNKPALPAWAAGMVAMLAVDQITELLRITEHEGREAAIAWLKAEPNRTKEKAAAIGKTIHAAIEAHTLGAPEGQWPLDYRGHQEQWKRFLDERQPVFKAAEFTVYDRMFGYAGTGDWLAFLPAVPGYDELGDVIGDTKTGKNVYASEVRLQLAAYRHGEFILLPDGTEIPIPKLDGGAVLHLRPDKYELIPFPASVADHQVFLHLLEVWRYADAREQEYRAGRKA